VAAVKRIDIRRNRKHHKYFAKLLEGSLVMSDKIRSSEKGPALIETPKGEDYRVVIDTEKCTSRG
jgi:hypothetical protein